MGGTPNSDGEMEGWLYLIRFNRFGLQYSRKKYFILQDNCLKSFNSKPSSDNQEPLRSAIIDSCIRVTDNGRETLNRKVFFIFTLYNTSNHYDQLKLGANSPEEAASWIRSLQDVALNPTNSVPCSNRKWQPFRMTVSNRTSQKKSIDWTSAASMHMDAMASDVMAPSPWKIFGCQNGQRLFKEAKERDSSGKQWDDHPAIMAVTVIDGTSEAIFRALMSVGPSRSEWDFCFHRGSVVEHLDGHTDIVHMQLYNNWLPWGMKRRDLLFRRYWRREDDGTYVILFHSVFHKKCPPNGDYVRAWIKSGGYVITPGNQGKESVVKHMLSINWKFWNSLVPKASERSITIHMLGKTAALRELFRAKAGNCSSEFRSEEVITRDIGLPQSEKEEIKMEVECFEEPSNIEEDKMDRSLPGNASLMGLNDAADEFFDVPEPSDDDQSEQDWDSTPQSCYQDVYQSKLSAAGLVKKWHDRTVQRKVCVEVQDASREERARCCFGTTLPKDPACTSPCSWAAADPSLFLIRGETYLKDNKKIKANGTLMQLVGADWLRSDKREDDLGSRPGGLVQKYAMLGGPEFFFIVNMQFPGSTTYNLALYYMLKTPLEETPLLERFVNGDDAFRNSRFKLIPYISKGSWIVKQSVGKKSCLLGQALQVNYFGGKNYLELDIDVGSSTVARGVVNLVLGYLNNLVMEMAFLIQGNTQEELPEFLLGTCRLNHLDVSKSVLVMP